MYARESEQIEIADQLDMTFNAKIIHCTWVNNVLYRKLCQVLSI